MAASQETTTKPTNDAYTGMLGISLFALILGCVLLYLDYSQYPDSKGPAIPKAPSVAMDSNVAPSGKEPAPKAPPQGKKPDEEPKEKGEADKSDKN